MLMAKKPQVTMMKMKSGMMVVASGQILPRDAPADS